MACLPIPPRVFSTATISFSTPSFALSPASSAAFETKVAEELVIALPKAPNNYNPVTAERLLNPEPQNWLMYRNTYDTHGHSGLDQINRDNVADLEPVWTLSTGPYEEVGTLTIRGHCELATGSDGFKFSRSVIERVLQSGEPVLSVDAAEDARFDGSRSITHLNLRSVLAVPLLFRGEMLGAAYVAGMMAPLIPLALLWGKARKRVSDRRLTLRLGTHAKRIGLTRLVGVVVFTGFGLLFIGLALSGNSETAPGFQATIGRWMRALSDDLDEVPNLVNVLRGEMSLVGPRPTVQVQVDRYDERQRHRLDALPGITGWAQVNGWRGNTSLEKRIEYDLYYIANWSVSLDLKIIWLTVLRGFGRQAL